LGDQILEDVMDRACDTWGSTGMHTEFWWENLFKDVGVDTWIIL
jgi:hypothetical protein